MIARLLALLQRRRLDAELDEELRLHLERMEEANRRSGMSAEEARRAARLAFGNPVALRERAREPYAFALESLLQDLGAHLPEANAEWESPPARRSSQQLRPPSLRST